MGSFNRLTKKRVRVFLAHCARKHSLKLRIPDDARRLTGVMMLFSCSRKEKRSNSVCRCKKRGAPGSYVSVPLHIPASLDFNPLPRIPYSPTCRYRSHTPGRNSRRGVGRRLSLHTFTLNRKQNKATRSSSVVNNRVG